MILRSSYEATLAAARLHHASTGNAIVYLTLIGGGVFGNPMSWIVEALARAIDLQADAPLDVRIVSYRRKNPDVSPMLTA